MEYLDKISMFRCDYYCIGTYLYERIGSRVDEYRISGVTIDYRVTGNSERLCIIYYIRDIIGQSAGISHDDIKSRFLLSDVRLDFDRYKKELKEGERLFMLGGMNYDPLLMRIIKIMNKEKGD